MSKLSCSSCASTDVIIGDKYYSCNHCSSVYLLPSKKTKLELLLNINVKYSIIISLIILALSVTLYKYYISQNFTNTTSYIQEEYFIQNDFRSIDRAGNGICYEYKIDGILNGEWIYSEGNIVTGKRFYKTGETRYDFRYKNGEAHGIRKEYYKSGKLKSDSPFVHGEKNGMEVGYFENGKIRYKIKYKDGLRVDNI
jgi:antitoxin component YwqK of YwqJK toxin-antitoxin module